MRIGDSRALAWLLPLMGSRARGEDVVYVTDLNIYTLLAPCAQSALRYNVMSMTYDACPEAVTELQSCVCTKNNYYASLSAAVSSDVSYSCGSTASSDQASASLVLSAYCHQDDAAATFASPAVTVSQYITDIPEMQYLAPCASSEVAYAVMGMTDDLCPPDAPHLATCACAKNQNSLAISQVINTQVSAACASHTADIASAQAFFAAYCGLNAGTSSFPSASNPPGDMSYYITDMPQYNSLARCAKYALSSAVLTNTYDLCPGGPQLLASCACIKESMSSVVASYITTNIAWECDDNDVADATSALNIFALYCSAARDEVVVTGITTSVSQTQPFGLGVPAATATGTATQATATAGATGGSSGGGSNGSSDEGSDGDSNDNTSDASSPSTAVIAGAAIGVVVFLGLLSAGAFFVWRHVRRNRKRPAPTEFQQLNNLPPMPSSGPSGPGGPGGPIGAAAATPYGGKAELADTPMVTPGDTPPYYSAGSGFKPPGPPPSPGALSMHKYGSSVSVSPQPSPSASFAQLSPGQPRPLPGSAYGYPPYAPSPPSPYGPYPPGPPPGPPPMPPPQHYAELQGDQDARPTTAELYAGSGGSGQNQPYSPLHPQHPQMPRPVYQADSMPAMSPQRTTTPGGMSFHSGPVPTSYAELDSSSQPHAR